MFDEDLVVPNHALSIAKGAVVPWAKSNPPSPYYMQVLSSLARAYDFDLHVPWKDLPEEARDVVLHGTHGRAVTLRFIDGKPQLRGQEAVRGRHRQPQPPHGADRVRLDARGAQPLPGQPPVRGLPRRPPQARGAQR